MTDMDPIEDEVAGGSQTSGDDSSTMTDDEKTADASDGTAGGDADASIAGGENVGADATAA